METTVIGYLTSWPSGDLVVAGRQKITRDWWKYASNAFQLITSELVLREASAGDPQAVQDRFEILEGLPALEVMPEADDLAKVLVAEGAVSATEPEDALHIATAVVNGIEYLVTWNFKHIANATVRWKIHDVCMAEGYDPSTICTPEELMEPEADV